MCLFYFERVSVTSWVPRLVLQRLLFPRCSCFFLLCLCSLGCSGFDGRGHHLVSVLLVLDGDVHSLLQIGKGHLFSAFRDLCLVIDHNGLLILLALDDDGFGCLIHFFNRSGKFFSLCRFLAGAGAVRTGAGAAVAAAFAGAGAGAVVPCAITPETKATMVRSATTRISFFILLYSFPFGFYDIYVISKRGANLMLENQKLL